MATLLSHRSRARLRRRLAATTVTAGLLGLFACASDGRTAPDAGPNSDAHDAGRLGIRDAGADDATTATAPGLSELVDDIFRPSCVLGRCHITQAPAGGLSFTGVRISPHEALVNQPSSATADRILVIPFDPDNSYLIEKLTAATPASGTPMPPFGPLPPESIDRIRAWIAAGARDD